MTFSIIASDQSLRRAAKFFRKHPDLRPAFEQLIESLRTDPFQPHHRLHPLQGQLKGLLAVSLTYQNRVVLIVDGERETITLIAIGSHDEVYGSSD